jgi:hypothetical protein
VYLELVVQAFTVRVQDAKSVKRTGKSAPMMIPAALGNASKHRERRKASVVLQLESVMERTSGKRRTGNRVKTVPDQNHHHPTFQFGGSSQGKTTTHILGKQAGIESL